MQPVKPLTQQLLLCQYSFTLVTLPRNLKGQFACEKEIEHSSVLKPPEPSRMFERKTDSLSGRVLNMQEVRKRYTSQCSAATGHCSQRQSPHWVGSTAIVLRYNKRLADSEAVYPRTVYPWALEPR